MKILAIFTDMLGADYLKIGNECNKESSMDSFLKRIGGTFFYNCYTPAPDTPRSSACMWSGLYPKKNGCNNRLKYPGSYLASDETFWHLLKDNGYEINGFVKKTMNEIGLLPHPFEQIVRHDNLKDAINDIEIRDNSFTFFYLPDLHLMLDTNGYDEKRFQLGVDVVVSCLEMIFEKFDLDFFDYFLMFSDHGFRCHEKKHLLEDDRIRTLMFLRKKGELELKIDYELRSNMDICPTILEMVGVKVRNHLDGKSLLGKGHEYLLCEDHEDFSVRLGQTIEHWAVIEKDCKHWLECSGMWSHEIENVDFDEKLWIQTISEKMDDYEENSKLYRLLHRYDGYKEDNDKFSNGVKVRIRFSQRRLIKNIRGLIKRVLYYVKNRK